MLNVSPSGLSLRHFVLMLTSVAVLGRHFRMSSEVGPGNGFLVRVGGFNW